MFAGAAGGVPRAVWRRGHGHVFWDVVEVQLPPFHLLMHVRYHLAVAFACLVAAAPSAQDGTPDSTPPEAYLPLDVGNEWVYVETRRAVAYREKVVADSVVGGATFAVVRRTEIGDSGWEGLQDTTITLVRVDPETAAVVRLGDGEEISDRCPLDAGFPAEGSDERPVLCGGAEAVVYGGPERDVYVGLPYRQPAEGTLKGFRFPDHTEVRYAAGIGRVSSYRYEEGEIDEILVYARTSAGEFGEVPVADPTDPAAYYPLDIGYEMESIRRMGGSGTTRTRRVIERDTLIGGVRFVAERTSTASGSWSGEVEDWGEGQVRFLRFDAERALVVEWTSDGEEPVTCPFDVPFNVVSDCQRLAGSNAAVFGYASFVFGGTSDGDLFIGDSFAGIEHDPAPMSARKHFDGLPLGFADSGSPGGFGAGIGPLPQQSFGFCTLCREDVTYLRLVDPDGSVREYGARYPVAADARPEAGALAVSAFPNPSAGPLTVAVDAPAAADVALEAFDALGRRVWRETARHGAEAGRVAVDAGGWAPGLYVVRALADGRAVTTTVVRR